MKRKFKKYLLTISNNNAYECSDLNDKSLFDSFDNSKEKFIGYFVVISIGFNNAFYFPKISSIGYEKPCLNIFFNEIKTII